MESDCVSELPPEELVFVEVFVFVEEGVLLGVLFCDVGDVEDVDVSVLLVLDELALVEVVEEPVEEVLEVVDDEVPFVLAVCLFANSTKLLIASKALAVLTS